MDDTSIKVPSASPLTPELPPSSTAQSPAKEPLKDQFQAFSFTSEVHGEREGNDEANKGRGDCQTKADQTNTEQQVVTQPVTQGAEKGNAAESDQQQAPEVAQNKSNIRRMSGTDASRDTSETRNFCLRNEDNGKEDGLPKEVQHPLEMRGAIDTVAELEVSSDDTVGGKAAEETQSSDKNKGADPSPGDTLCHSQDTTVNNCMCDMT